MAVVPFDTLRLADRLAAGGFSPEQARTAATAFADAMTGADLVTKGDIKYLATKTDLAETRADVLKSVMSMLVSATAINVVAVFAAMVGLAKLLGH